MEKNNIFKNAYFGKAYKTRDGRKALYVGKAYGLGIYVYLLVIEGSDDLDEFAQDGSFNVGSEHPFDIISEWQEPIDGEKLDIFAKEYIKDKKEQSMRIASYNGFRAGFRKAIEYLVKNHLI